MIGRHNFGRLFTRTSGALLGLALIAMAIALLPYASARHAEAQAQDGCSEYPICIGKETIPGSNVAFAFIIEIEEVKSDSQSTVNGAIIDGSETVYLSDGDEVGIKFYGEARITEVPVPGWELVDIECVGNEYSWSTSGSTLEIYYLVGSESAFLDCTFVNRRTEGDRRSGGPAPGLGAGLGGLFAGQPTPLPTARPAAAAPAATAPTISPPRTGDAGLK